MNQKLLIVDEDIGWASELKQFFEQQHFDVTIATSAEEGKEKFMTEYPCMIILELALPKMSGEEFCIWVRQHQTADVSIMMVSKKHAIQDKINGLTIGADDYLTKPVHIEELHAHMQAVLRRSGLFCQKVIYEGLCIKPRKGVVLLNGQTVQLTKLEFALLYLFMNHPNQILTRADLIHHLYPNMEKEILDRTIDAHIKNLRLKVEDNPKKPTRIITVRGIGYKFSSTNTNNKEGYLES